MESNRIEWDGTESNRIKSNGIEWDGMAWHGMAWNGIGRRAIEYLRSHCRRVDRSERSAALPCEEHATKRNVTTDRPSLPDAAAGRPPADDAECAASTCPISFVTFVEQQRLLR